MCGFGGELPNGLESAGFESNAESGKAVVAAIRRAKEAAVGSDFQIRAGVGWIEIFRESGQGLPKAALACLCCGQK